MPSPNDLRISRSLRRIPSELGAFKNLNTHYLIRHLFNCLEKRLSMLSNVVWALKLSPDLSRASIWDAEWWIGFQPYRFGNRNFLAFEVEKKFKLKNLEFKWRAHLKFSPNFKWPECTSCHRKMQITIGWDVSQRLLVCSPASIRCHRLMTLSNCVYPLHRWYLVADESSSPLSSCLRFGDLEQP